VARVRAEFDAHWRQTITDVVLDGQRDGEFGPTDAADFAVALSAMMDGLAIQIALHDPVVDPGRAFQTSMRFAAQSLGFPWKPTTGKRRSERVATAKK
jgi:hypothetical protein